MGINPDGGPITPREGSWAHEQEQAASRKLIDDIRDQAGKAVKARLSGNIQAAQFYERNVDQLMIKAREAGLDAEAAEAEAEAQEGAQFDATTSLDEIDDPEHDRNRPGSKMHSPKPIPYKHDTASLDEILHGMAKMADTADEAGLTAEADVLTASLRRLALVKKAQYEGGTHYWIMNGRAFERAWKMKREKNKLSDNLPTTDGDFNSFQECWLEVLDEYQDALMGNHEDFLKYASKKKIEKGMDGGMGGGGATMSKEMTEFHKGLEDQAREMDISIGELVTRKFGPKGMDDKEAASAIMAKISERLMDGSEPGVAFYEAMDYFVNGGYAADAMSDAIEAIETTQRSASLGLHESIIREAQFWQNLKDIGRGWMDKGKGWMQEEGRQVTDALQGFGGGPASKLYQEIRQAMPQVQAGLKQIYDGISTGALKAHPNTVVQTARPLLDKMKQFFGIMRQAGMNPPNLSEIMRPPSGPKGMEAAHFQQWFNTLKANMRAINRQAATMADKAVGQPAQQQAQPQAAPGGA